MGKSKELATAVADDGGCVGIMTVTGSDFADGTNVHAR